MRFFYTVFFLILIAGTSSQATHIMGGEIRASHISVQTYKVSAILYVDGTNGAAASGAQNELAACMGDGNTIILLKTSSNTLAGSQGIAVATYEANYTYPSSGTFQISISENNRLNALNFPAGNQSTFFIWTVINTQLPNSTPELPYLNFDAGVRQVFAVDLKPVTSDADSLSFRLQKLSKPSPGTCGVRGLDQTYLYPNDVSKTGTFTINQTSKKLIWTAPEQAGNYIYAMVVTEWRDGIKISEVYREGRINVTDKPGGTVEIPPYQYAQEGDVITSIPKMDSPELSIAVEAFPVPTEDFITVKAYTKKRSVVTLQIIDMQGRVLKEVKTSEAVTAIQEEFDLRSYSRGMYLIRVENDLESVSQKIIR